jgi:hypothetical protein
MQHTNKGNIAHKNTVNQQKNYTEYYGQIVITTNTQASMWLISNPRESAA